MIGVTKTLNLSGCSMLQCEVTMNKGNKALSIVNRQLVFSA